MSWYLISLPTIVAGRHPTVLHLAPISNPPTRTITATLSFVSSAIATAKFHCPAQNKSQAGRQPERKMTVYRRSTTTPSSCHMDRVPFVSVTEYCGQFHQSRSAPPPAYGSRLPHHNLRAMSSHNQPKVVPKKIIIRTTRPPRRHSSRRRRP